MSDTLKPYRMITDFVTGRSIPEMGAEANRQAVERLLVEQKGFAKTDIEVDVAIAFEVAGEPYRSRLDLVVRVEGSRLMVVKCPAGSLGSWEREAVAAARLLDGDTQIPLAVVSDGKTAVVLDTVTGKRRGEGLDAVPSRAQAPEYLTAHPPLDPGRLRKERLLFRTYDREAVNRPPAGPR